jgi:hypothetical protein
MRNLPILIATLTLGTSTLFSMADGAVANDDAAGATLVTSLPFSDLFDGTLTTLEIDEPQGGEFCPSLGSSAWYRYTPAVDADLQISTFGSTGDTAFAMWTGGPGDTLIRCNDNLAAGALLANAPATVEGGVEIWLQIGHLAGAAGTLSVTVSELATIPEPCAGDACPTYRVYEVPGPMGGNAGETNIGFNPLTNTTMLLLMTRAIATTFDGSDAATFTDVTEPILSTTNDPILWTDPDTGRTLIAQLKAQIGSVIGFTDDDGDTWQISEPGVVLPSWDHQSIGGGPYPAPLRELNPVYPNAIYYCAQTGFSASQCARSDNGGLTWLGPFPMNVANCGGLHGHIAVSPVTGTVAVPHKGCGSDQGVLFSTTAAQTWTASPIPGTTPALADPAGAFDAAGRYYALTTSSGHPLVSVTADEGASWSEPIDIGTTFGIQNTTFPMAVAGDDGRAAVAFYGSTMPGSDQGGFFNGAWHVYIATTIDAGATWTLVDATPNDPVQRGCIWMQGGGNPCRNLLDFQGMTVDNDGRVLVSIADGCLRLTQCSGPAGTNELSRADRGAIIRQMSGPRLVAD